MKTFSVKVHIDVFKNTHKYWIRKSKYITYIRILDYNIEFRCTYYMTNVKLERLPELYNLPIIQIYELVEMINSASS